MFGLLYEQFKDFLFGSKLPSMYYPQQNEIGNQLIPGHMCSLVFFVYNNNLIHEIFLVVSMNDFIVFVHLWEYAFKSKILILGKHCVLESLYLKPMYLHSIWISSHMSFCTNMRWTFIQTRHCVYNLTKLRCQRYLEIGLSNEETSYSNQFTSNNINIH